MELGFDFANELGVKVTMLWRLISIRAPLPSLVCVSSYKDVVVVVLREKQHRFCFRCFFSAVVFLLLLFCLYFLFKNN